MSIDVIVMLLEVLYGVCAYEDCAICSYFEIRPEGTLYSIVSENSLSVLKFIRFSDFHFYS